MWCDTVFSMRQYKNDRLRTVVVRCPYLARLVWIVYSLAACCFGRVVELLVFHFFVVAAKE